MPTLRTLYNTGNSTVLAIPTPYLDLLHLNVGDQVQIDFVPPGEIRLKPAKYTHLSDQYPSKYSSKPEIPPNPDSQ